MVSSNHKKVGFWGIFSGLGTRNLFFLPQEAIINHQLYMKVLESHLLLKKTKKKASS